MRTDLLFVGACLFAAVLPVFVLRAEPPPIQSQSSTAVQSVLPTARGVAVQALAATHLRDRPLTQQPLTALEERFAANFPGAIVRFRSGDATLIVRRVAQATRQLHPAADCFRAAGYALGTTRPHEDARGGRWNCFQASQGGGRWRVCERIVDASGQQWTDVSGWYWSALWAQRRADSGTWWAITLVTRFEPEDKS
jgi:hypothetical protein